MGRTKKKPGYDQNKIMEQFQNCIVEAYTSGMTDGSSISLRQVSEEFGITLMKTRKILITAGMWFCLSCRRGMPVCAGESGAAAGTCGSGI